MHILATEVASLDEAGTAVDLAQSPADIVVLSFSDSDLSALAAAWQRDAEALPSLRLASLKLLRHPMSVDLYVDAVASKAKVVIVRCLGGLDYWRYGLERIADVARENGIRFAALPGDDRPDPRLAAASTLPRDKLALLDAFFREGGAGNLGNALRQSPQPSAERLCLATPICNPQSGNGCETTRTQQRYRTIVWRDGLTWTGVGWIFIAHARRRGSCLEAGQTS